MSDPSRTKRFIYALLFHYIKEFEDDAAPVFEITKVCEYLSKIKSDQIDVRNNLSAIDNNLATILCFCIDYGLGDSSTKVHDEVYKHCCALIQHIPNTDL